MKRFYNIIYYFICFSRVWSFAKQSREKNRKNFKRFVWTGLSGNSKIDREPKSIRYALWYR